MYVCLYYKKSENGNRMPAWEIFEDVNLMFKTIDRLGDEAELGPILTFQTQSAFVYNKHN